VEEKENADEEALKKQLVKPCFDMLKFPLLSKMFGGGTAGRKIAKYIQAVRRGDLEAELDLLPTDKLEFEEAAEKRAERVKATQNQRSSHRAAKTQPENVSKPLEDNEIAGANEQESSQAQSNPVKVNQTDLAPISPIPPLAPISPIPPENGSVPPTDAAENPAGIGPHSRYLEPV
jgi:hypothetical protein